MRISWPALVRSSSPAIWKTDGNRVAQVRVDGLGLRSGPAPESSVRKTRITEINKKSLDLLQEYSWPGNIRELQNIIERSVIVGSGNIFSVDESWLCKGSTSRPSRAQTSAPVELERPGEKEIIEAALAESKGRVDGPSGAAAKLKIPRSTLESRIRALKISKSRFKFD